MNQLSVSVVVVSRGRPELLKRCLAGLRQLFYQNFEVVVVADPAGVQGARDFGAHAKLAPFDQANISAARNIGINLAAGTIVAFIDDDAVAEPTWLNHLTKPFSDPSVAAAGGYVRARNGITFQWKASVADAFGVSTPLPIDGDDPVVFDGQAGRAIRTEGTNCAFRRDVLARLGGFDPAFHFFLDETDVNMRLANAGAKTAIVPLAQVHHGYAASSLRTRFRMPKSLFEIGASSAVYFRKHTPGRDLDGAFRNLQRAQRQRLVSHMVSGNCEPRDVGRIMRTLSDGWQDGLTRDHSQMAPIPAAKTAFLPLRATPAPSRSTVISGRSWQVRRLRALARKDAAAGGVASLFLFSPTALFHRVAFHKDGYWQQTGGLFGRAERSEKLFSYNTFRGRVAKEWARVAKLRHAHNLSPSLDDVKE